MIIPLRGLQRKALPRFRCISCLVAFTPTFGATDYCPQCAAGHGLYVAIRKYQARVSS
jgi:hypothetical protein